MDKLVKTLKAALERSGISARHASMIVFNKPDVIRDIFNGHKPSFDKVERIFDALNINFCYGFETNANPNPTGDIPLQGNISAGGGASPNDGRVAIATDPTGGITSPPPNLTDDAIKKWGGLIALTIEGDSMRPLYFNGDTIYIYANDPLKYEPERLIGRDCAVILGGDRVGEVFLKRLRRADNNQRGHFNLESINLNWHMMTDIPIDYVYPVRYSRRNF